MEQCISKSALVAEIEERRDNLISLSESCPANTAAKSGFYAQAKTLEGIKNFLDVLEVKEVDLEKRRSFNEGVWYAVQHLVLEEDEPTLARDLLKTMNVEQKEWSAIQYVTGYQNDKMIKFLKSI